MRQDIKIRLGWLRGMYIYTIVGAGLFGLGMLVMPQLLKSTFIWPVEEPIVFGIVGSVYVAFGLLSILGLMYPLKFVTILLLQLCYKSIWIIGVFLPLIFTGQFPAYGIVFIIIFATYIIGDLIAIPFHYIFEKQSD